MCEWRVRAVVKKEQLSFLICKPVSWIRKVNVYILISWAARDLSSCFTMEIQSISRVSSQDFCKCLWPGLWLLPVDWIQLPLKTMIQVFCLRELLHLACFWNEVSVATKVFRYIIVSIQCGVVAVSVVKKENPNRKLSDGRAFFVYAWSWVFFFFFLQVGVVFPHW